MKTISLINQFLKQATKNSIPVIAGLSMLAMLSMAACTNDKDINDYRRDQEQNVQAKYSKVAAVYNGQITSMEDNEALGSITVDIESAKDVQTSADGLNNENHASLKVDLSVQGPVNGIVASETANYDPTTGEFDAKFPIMDQNNQTVNLQMTGSILNGVLKATIKTDLYVAYGAYIEAYVNTPPPAVSVSGTSKRMQQLAGDAASFSGKVKAVSGRSMAVGLNISEPNSTPQQVFLRLVNPQRAVIVTVTVDGGVGWNFPAATTTIDDANNKLNGVSTASAAGYTANLDCKRALTVKAGWVCNIDAQTRKLTNVLFTQIP
jgi:hypothetical protein